jgi:hypothetical protein
MKNLPTPKSGLVLMVFSNPSDTNRLRLDREHRLLDEVIKDANIDSSVLHRLHAATIEDLISELSNKDTRVVHFSGHGSPLGVYLEQSKSSEKGFLLPSDKLTNLIQATCKNIQALILASCYSASQLETLKMAAPYVITISGPADDDASILFSRYFYESYLKTESVETALDQAQAALDALGHKDDLKLVVSRRGENASAGRTIIRSKKYQFAEDTILIDITDIQTQISSLGIPSEEFLAILANKMRMHRWMWLESKNMENAILPIGRFFGVFGWQNGMDVIVCRKIIRLKDEAKEHDCNLWMCIVFDYNRLFGLAYRQSTERIVAGMDAKLKKALNSYDNTVQWLMSNKEQLLTLLPDQTKLALPLMKRNLMIAKEEFRQRDHTQTVVHLETILSLIHGIADGLLSILAD